MEHGAIDDMSVLERQMGRPPRGVDGVVCRCRFGYPQVIRVRPVVDGAPFPTLYWLTCPLLVRGVSTLEAEGWVARLERELREDDRFFVAVELAHQEYVASRRALLGDDDRRKVASPGALRDLETKGIGGIADRRAVKCLHLHIAHAMASGNPIGQRVLAALAAQECGAQNVICSAPG